MARQFSDKDRAAMEALAMQMVKCANDALPFLSKGAAVQAVVLGCAAVIQNFVPPGMSRQDHNAFAEMCADDMIEKLVSMYGK